MPPSGIWEAHYFLYLFWTILCCQEYSFHHVYGEIGFHVGLYVKLGSGLKPPLSKELGPV
jgi:hypothetical protein